MLAGEIRYLFETDQYIKIGYVGKRLVIYTTLLSEEEVVVEIPQLERTSRIDPEQVREQRLLNQIESLTKEYHRNVELWAKAYGLDINKIEI